MPIPGLTDRRFDNREVRIHRREERDLFRRKLIPVAWFLSAIGAAGLLILGAYYMLYAEWLHQFSGLFVALAILPFVLYVVSWLRGHYNPELEEP